MTRIASITLWIALCVIPPNVQAQQNSVGIPPETYLITHLWGSPSAISTEHVAMGGASVGDSRRDWHANPASLPSIVSSTPYFSYGRTGFDALPTFVSTSVGYVQPLKDGRLALKLIAFFVRSDGPAAALGGLNMKAQETDVAVEVGFRLTKYLSVGAGTSYISTESDYGIPGVATITRLESRPSGGGGRIGVLATPAKWISGGFSFDAYSERVTQELPSVALRTETLFKSRAYRGGVAFYPGDRTKILVDREYTRVTALEVAVIDDGVWKVGGEHRLGALSLRAGLFGKRPTGSLGFTTRGIDLSYSVSGRFARDLPTTGAQMQHFVQITRAF